LQEKRQPILACRDDQELLEAGGVFGKVGAPDGDSEEAEKCKQARP
jgi:hypothetical protein